MLTDNRVLLERLQPLPALMCVQRKAPKKIVTEDDLIRSNIDSFGDDIGKITNRITAMFEVQARFEKDSPEYQMLDYRIRCGQLYQQNAIDKAKGIISKPMPRSWYDRHSAALIEDEGERRLYFSIIADRKPYFMRYIYPDLMRKYNTYIKNVDNKAQREFGLTVTELLAKSPAELGEREAAFLRAYYYRMPVGISDCVMNRICRKFEDVFDGYVAKHKSSTPFDYSIMSSGAEYSRSQYNSILNLYKEYNKRLRNYMIFSKRERIDGDEAISHMISMRDEFRSACDFVCSNSTTLCDIMLDICYRRSSTKNFVWSMCGDEIVGTLLSQKDNMISFPVLDSQGDISFGGKKFTLCRKCVEVDE